MLEGHIIFLEGKLAVTETVNFWEKTADDLEAYSRPPCLIVSGVKKEKNEKMENLTETIIDKLEQTGILKEELKTNIDQLHRTGPYQHSTNTQPEMVKFKSHNFKEKKFGTRKNVNKKASFTTAKFVFADDHGSLKLVLQNHVKTGLFFLLTLN